MLVPSSDMFMGQIPAAYSTPLARRTATVVGESCWKMSPILVFQSVTPYTSLKLEHGLRLPPCASPVSSDATAARIIMQDAAVTVGWVQVTLVAKMATAIGTSASTYPSTQAAIRTRHLRWP